MTGHTYLQITSHRKKVKDTVTGCYTNIMEPVLIPNNTLELFFFSDGFMTGKGFNITFQEQDSTL